MISIIINISCMPLEILCSRGNSNTCILCIHMQTVGPWYYILWKQCILNCNNGYGRVGSYILYMLEYTHDYIKVQLKVSLFLLAVVCFPTVLCTHFRFLFYFIHFSLSTSSSTTRHACSSLSCLRLSVSLFLSCLFNNRGGAGEVVIQLKPRP